MGAPGPPGPAIEQPWRGRVRLAAALLSWRLVQHALVLGSFLLLPSFFQLDNYRDNFHWPEGEPPTLATAFQTWDAQHYLYLSGHRYEAGHPSVALLPLWPWAIGAGSRLLGGRTLLAALVLAGTLSVAAGLLFHRMAERRLGAEAADASLLLLLAYPGAFFFGLPYAESLFLLLALAVLDRLERGRLVQAGMAGFLMPLTRPPGVFVVFPIALAVLRQWRAERQLRAAAALALLLPCLGAATHAGLLWWQTGDPLASVHIQASYMGRGSLLRLLDPALLWRELVSVDALHSARGSLLDRAAFLAFLATLPAIGRLDRLYLAYALPMGLVTGLLQGGFTCFLRYLAVVFPVFMAWGRGLAGPRRAPWRGLVLAALLALQLVLLLRHVNNYWTA